MTHTVLHIDASARSNDSATRGLSRKIVDRLAPTRIIRRDLATPLPLIDETWVGANFTPEEQRDDVQRDTLALSDKLINEMKEADTLVIGLPVYNFGVPASFKAWIDQVMRAGVTFAYTAEGPKGQLEGKRAIVAVASGGTPFGSDWDFASGYVRHVLGFVGITEVEFIAADKMATDPETALADANAAVDALAA